MIISIDGRCLEGERTGTGRYLINLLKFWRKENSCRFKLYFKEKIPQDEILKSGNFELRILKNYLGFQSNFFFEHFLLPLAIKKDKADIFFSPYYLLPFYCPAKSVVTLHDISYEAHPEWFSLKNQFLLRRISKMAARRADIILTVSEFSKGEIVKYYQVDPDKITVTPLAADGIFRVIPQTSPDLSLVRRGKIPLVPFDKGRINPLLTKEGLGEVIKNKFILSVGSIFNRRHIPELIEAFKKIAGEFPGIQLLIIGANRTQPFIDIDKTIRETNKNLDYRAIIREDYVSEKDLAALYNLAECSVYLSDYEGFGLPLLESMASGTPVITSRKTSLVEAGGEAAIFVNSNNPPDIYDKIKKVLADENFRKERVKKGLENVKRFSWERCARETLKTFKK